MATETQRDFFFEKDGKVRICVFIQDARNHYAHNLTYRDEPTALAELDADVVRLEALSDVCVELQGELEKPQYWRERTVGRLQIRPFERRVYLKEQDGKPELRVAMVDEVLDPAQEPSDRFVQVCPAGCRYSATNASELFIHVGHLNKLVAERVATFAKRKELVDRARARSSRGG